jgi:hypothetical protein
MKNLSFLFTIIFLVTGAFAEAGVRTRGYVRKNGTYVAPHNRTSPDHSKSNNWSTKGNVNPYTGKRGTVDPGKPKSR